MQENDRKKRKWSNIGLDEFKALIGCLYSTGIARLPNYQCIGQVLQDFLTIKEYEIYLHIKDLATYGHVCV